MHHWKLFPALCLEENPELEKDLPRFVGLQQVEVGK